MSPQPTTSDYKTGSAGHKSGPSGANIPARPTAGPNDAPHTQHGGLAAAEQFLQLLAKAVRQFHTYPSTSPLCTDAIAVCQKALAALDRGDRLTLCVAPREFIVDDTGLGAGTIVEHELVRRLHKAHVAGLDVERTASPRDLSRLCIDVIRCDDHGDETTFADRLIEQGVDTIVARMARRPEVLDLGLPSAPLRDLVDHDQQRRRAAPATGPVDYLYPPEKGWVRLDPAANLETISLVDLAVLVNDPGDMATMLLRLTDDDPVGAITGSEALERKFTDVAMLFSALDGHLARVMFGKLARAVLALDADRRTALLRRTILPGLLDGRADGAVLRDFPDPDLAESLCLLLEFETAAPEVVGAALNRLDLSADRRQTVASLVDDRLHAGVPTTSGAAGTPDQSADRFARRLMRVDATPGKSFAEFAAFDLSIDEQTAATIANMRQAIAVVDTTIAQLDCLWRLVRLEPNPGLVATFMRRTLDLFGELDRAGRWRDLAAAAARFHHLAKDLRDARQDVVDAIDTALGEHWTGSRALALLALHERDEEGRGEVRLLFDAFGPSLAHGFVELLGDASLQPATGSLLPLLCDHAALLAPGLVMHMGRGVPLVDRAIVRVLGIAGAGYEVAISEQLASRDEQTVRAALRALARIGTGRAAALVAFRIHDGGAVARAAEEALWHFPPAQTTLQIRELLSRRDFVVRHPDVVTRLIDRASLAGVGDLGDVLEELEALRFRLWNPELVRVALKARGMRAR
jgi:hypothetical protein